MSPCDWNKGKGCTHHNLIERNSWGWAKIGDTFYRRISTEAATLDDKGGLIHWSANNVARGLGLSRALRDRAVVAALSGDPDELKEITKEAQDKGGAQDAASRGTTVHDVVLPALVSGIDPDLDDPSLMSTLAAARAVLAEGKLKAVMCEQFVVNTDQGHCGTWDLLLQSEETKEFYLADAKSSVKLNDRRYPSKVAVQLASYAHGKRWCPVEGELRTPKVNLERGFLLSLPLDAGEAYLDALDLDAGWSGLHLAQDVTSWRKQKFLLPGGLHVVASTDAPTRSLADASQEGNTP